VGKGRSSQEGNKDRIQLGFLSRNTFDGLWQFDKKKSQLIVLFCASQKNCTLIFVIHFSVLSSVAFL